jgi:Spy/CpxP family protein refolding chaperone
MRPIVVLAALALVAASAPRLVAQSGPSAPAQEAKAGKRDKGIPELFDGITLTEEQKTKIRSLHHDYHTQMTALKVTNKKKNNDGKTLPLPDKVKKQIADLETKEHAELRAVLTPDQTATFDKNLAKEMAEEAKANAEKAAEKAKP